jgi:hypothetical protein
LCALIVSAFISCGGKTVQYPEDHERILRIDQAVESLRKAYVDRSRSAFDSLLLPTGNLSAVQRDVQGDFDMFRDITLDFSIERIMIAGEDVDVFVHWQGQWKKTVEDIGVRYRGHTRLQYAGTDSILLKDVQGDLPFGLRNRSTPADAPKLGGRQP